MCMFEENLLSNAKSQRKYSPASPVIKLLLHHQSPVLPLLSHLDTLDIQVFSEQGHMWQVNFQSYYEILDFSTFILKK